MRKLLTLLIILVNGYFLIACTTALDFNQQMSNVVNNLPGIHKIDVPQGNIVTQEMANQLRPGMDKRQIKFILGTPLLVDPFHKNRWDYFYELKKGGKQSSKERVTVIFEGNELINIKGNFKPSKEFKPMAINTEVVDVPKYDEKNGGIIESVLRAIGIEYDDKY